MPWHVSYTSPQFIRGRAGRRIDGVGWEPPSLAASCPASALSPSPYSAAVPQMLRRVLGCVLPAMLNPPPTKRSAAIPMCSTGHPPNALAAVPGGVLPSICPVAAPKCSAAVPGCVLRPPTLSRRPPMLSRRPRRRPAPATPSRRPPNAQPPPAKRSSGHPPNAQPPSSAASCSRNAQPPSPYAQPPSSAALAQILGPAWPKGQSSRPVLTAHRSQPASPKMSRRRPAS